MEALHLAAWTVTTLLCVLSYEVTVRSSDLLLCEDDDRVCVTDLGDCGPRPPSSEQKALNMSCYYQESQRSMTCAWSEDSDGHADATVSLIFICNRTVSSCQTLFNPAEQLKVTARLGRYSADTWSRPHPLFVYQATKPPPPELGVGGSTVDSVDVRWGSSSDVDCQLRYRADHTQTWSQVPDVISTPRGQKQVYTIRGLLPFTVYTAAVACRKTSGLWSDWSAGVSVMTLQPVPSRSPQVCYRLESTASGGRLLHLMWKALDSHGRILGYQVGYGPVAGQQLQDRVVLNVTEEATTLEVEEGNWSVSVAAFNAAGCGPPANLSVDTQTPNALPSVRNLWVFSSFPAVKGLSVRWATPTGFDVACRWRAETGGRWSTVEGATSCALIQDVDPDQLYLISVFAVYKQQCGAPQSLSASLQHGALMEPVNLKLVHSNKTAVTVMWTWQKKSGPIRVDGYRVMLWSHSETQTQPLWPDQSRHTFPNLRPSTEYSLVLLADDASTASLSVWTDFDEVPLVSAATPLLLLAVIVLIVSILSRTVVKSRKRRPPPQGPQSGFHVSDNERSAQVFPARLKGFFFPHVSSPQDSTLGQWLMDPSPTNPADPNTLDIKRFQDTDVLGVKSAIVVGPRCSGPWEDAAPPPHGPLVKLSDIRLDAECEDCGGPAATEHQPQHHLPDQASGCAESRGAGPPLRQTRDSNGSVPAEDDNWQLARLTSQQARDCVNRRFPHLVARANTHCSGQITCEEEYVGKAEPDRAVTCDAGYIPNADPVRQQCIRNSK